jgi:hypothetical protein
MSLLFRETESEELRGVDHLEFIDWRRECFSHYLAHIENETRLCLPIHFHMPG